MFQGMTLHLCTYKQQQLELVSYLQTKEERTDIVLTRGCEVENWIWGKDPGSVGGGADDQNI